MDNTVYLGVWTNWSRGQILGQTLTTTKGAGNLVIAFTAVFIGFVASRLWKILCLLLHRTSSKPHSSSTIHQQRQIILRNSATAENTLFTTLDVFWAWKQVNGRHLSSLLALACLAGVYSTLFAIAGGFSSQISTAMGDEVLLQGTQCGLKDRRTKTVGDFTQVVLDSAEDIGNAANYASQCYGNSMIETTQCTRFVTDRLKYKMNANASCPFQEEMCRGRESNLLLDTGYLDSNDDFGMNAPVIDRFAWRHVLHCAPIETAGFVSHISNGSEGRDRYHYATWNRQSNNSGYLFEAADIRLEESAFAPIPELYRSDGDVWLIFLFGNGVLFNKRMDGEWYTAGRPQGNIQLKNTSEAQESYGLNAAAAPLGCVEQWQWCTSSPTDRHCGPLASWRDSLSGVVSYFDLDRDVFDADYFDVSSDNFDTDRPVPASPSAARIIWPSFILGSFRGGIENIIAIIGAQSLASQRRFYSGIQWEVPDNQWQLDVQHWWHTILACIQASWYVQPCSNPFHSLTHIACAKIRSSAYASFSVLGLSLTYAIGGLVIGASFVIEPVIAWLYKSREYKPYAHLEWRSTTNLHLHRLAHEKPGFQDRWSRCDKDVPVTDLRLLLDGLDISNPSHPLLPRTTDPPPAEGPPSGKSEVEVADTFSDDASDGSGVTVEPRGLRAW
ncbi:hypothetical protein F4780DRAFT_798170 [Xylariomycetidae sp. FL0641]|nr:hypothetical protein F4780DRAFT_798170 [Xylariomycetidae sp. FL0641]